MRFDDSNTSGIQVNNADIHEVSPYYDLMGRKVAQPATKGLYIRNGKKTVVK